jgi:hypothetical protein
MLPQTTREAYSSALHYIINYHFGLHHSPSSRLIFRLIHYGIELSPTDHFNGYVTATILPPYVNPFNSTELGSDPLCWIRGGENIPAQATTHSALLLDIQSNLLAQLAMVIRTLEALLPQERIFILPRRVTVKYPGSSTSLTETVFQARICKNYSHQPPQLPVYINSTVRTSRARLRLGLTQDCPSRPLVIRGYSFELFHPDGTSFPGNRSPFPHYSLRFAQPFLVITGIAPGYSPDQILAALHQHDQLATQAAQTEGYRRPMPIADRIHLVVCCPGSLDSRPRNAGQPPPADSWLLYFNAGVQIPSFTPTAAIIALGTEYRRPNVNLREDRHYVRSFRDAAACNPIAQDQHILRPYSYAAAARVQEEIIRINALAEAPTPELDIATQYSPPSPSNANLSTANTQESSLPSAPSQNIPSFTPPLDNNPTAFPSQSASTQHFPTSTPLLDDNLPSPAQYPQHSHTSSLSSLSTNPNNLTNPPTPTPLPRAATLFHYFAPLSQSRTPTDNPPTATTSATP